MQKRAWAAAAALLVMIIFGPSWAMAYFIEGFDPVPVPAPPGISGPASPAPGSSGSRETITVSSIGYKMVYLEPGTFMMGSPSSEPGRHGGETRHRVTLTKGFYIGATEVTQGQWKKMMGSNPSENPGDDCPVEQVSWEDCQQFIQKLNRLEGTDKYRLPTEAEWEYACRAGSETAYCFGSGAGQLDQYAWYDDNSRGRAHPVGLKKPNAWGLYDMHGNVLEWCQDWYDGGIYPSGSVTDPTGPSSGIWLLLRAPPPGVPGRQLGRQLELRRQGLPFSRSLHRLARRQVRLPGAAPRQGFVAFCYTVAGRMTTAPSLPLPASGERAGVRSYKIIQENAHAEQDMDRGFCVDSRGRFCNPIRPGLLHRGI